MQVTSDDVVGIYSKVQVDCDDDNNCSWLDIFGVFLAAAWLAGTVKRNGNFPRVCNPTAGHRRVEKWASQ